MFTKTAKPHSQLAEEHAKHAMQALNGNQLERAQVFATLAVYERLTEAATGPRSASLPPAA